MRARRIEDALTLIVQEKIVALCFVLFHFHLKFHE